MKDNTGQTVMTGLNEEMCRQIAQAGGGAYIHVENNSSAQEKLDEELDKLAKKEISSTIYSDYDEQFQAVGILALLLLIIEACLLEVQNPLLRNISLFKRKKVVAVLALLLMAGTAAAQSDRQYVHKGNKQFRAGNYADAEVLYRKAIEKNPRNPQAVYNLGVALMKQQKDSAAVQQFMDAGKIETNPLRRALSYHNAGVICQGKKMSMSIRRLCATILPMTRHAITWSSASVSRNSSNRISSSNNSKSRISKNRSKKKRKTSRSSNNRSRNSRNSR